mmetsp:Transcript_26739/g.67475  ORF Transcript_26739/g.67475 Transcript_26739/m.67475 type:complete len:205 (+) Transcript_26739:387-1001(+)
MRQRRRGGLRRQDHSQQAGLHQPGAGREPHPQHGEPGREPARAKVLRVLHPPQPPMPRLGAPRRQSLRAPAAELLPGAVPEPHQSHHAAVPRRAHLLQRKGDHTLRPQARKRHAEKHHLPPNQGHRPGLGLLREPRCLHVHPVPLLPLPGGPAAAPLCGPDRHMVARMHWRRALPRPPPLAGHLRVQPGVQDRRVARAAAEAPP